MLVLLDEPMAGLDPGGRDEMLDLIRKTHRDFGISVVLSSHIMGDVERACERILVLESGRVAQEGQVSAFAGDTETIYVEVTDRRDEFVAALRERRIEPGLEGGAVVVEDVDDEGYDTIRDALVAVRRAAASDGAPAPRARPSSSRSTAEDGEMSGAGAGSSTSASGATRGRGRGAGGRSSSVYKDGLRAALGLGRGAPCEGAAVALHRRVACCRR